MTSSRLKRARPLLALGALALIWALAWQAGLQEVTSIEGLRAMMADAGSLGIVVFLALFAVAGVTGLPGLPFVFAALLSYGAVLGFLVAFAGTLLFTTVGFVAARWAGGSYESAAVKSRLMRRLLERVEARPLRTTVALRAVFALGPPVAFGLALSNLKLRTYLLGTAIGLAPLLLVLSLTFEWWLG